MKAKEFKRVIIENVTPEVNHGDFPAKGVIDEECFVEADIFTDGHLRVASRLYYKHEEEGKWQQTSLKPLSNDRWQGSFFPRKLGNYQFFIEGWVDEFGSWQKDFKKKREAGLDLEEEFRIGANILLRLGKKSSKKDFFQKIVKALEGKTREAEKIALVFSEDLQRNLDLLPLDKSLVTKSGVLRVETARKKALFSTWYELFPRSCTNDSKKHGTFLNVLKEIPRLAKMGFDVLYFPPIHPIGKTKRKGKNNSLTAEAHDPGSPWAIGGKDGAHKAIHKDLGTLEDFKKLIKEAKKHGIEIALDLAFQCSPDHPYIKEHPGWFEWRPDGTIQYAENPPKKYEDIVPFHFTLENKEELFQELLSIVLFWVSQGIKIFRVDNPHTKPFALWEWLIREVKAESNDVLFLSEAFTRPKVRERLAKIGFDQSYTYFTWRTTKFELTEYLKQLTGPLMRHYFRPNFWVNTPDILPEHLQVGIKASFQSRLLLAATLSSNYGMYGPAFELMLSDAIEGKEEYRDSEKYEIKNWSAVERNRLDDFISLVNQIRKDNRALQDTYNLEFFFIPNDFLLAFGKYDRNHKNYLIVVINLDNENVQSGMLEIPLDRLGISEDRPFMVHDLLTNHRYIWQGRRQYIELRPYEVPGHIFKVLPAMHREENFDYYT
ncbi:alpha-1,4-glucan--maltose-1-phosphate maltosyltransferase [Criblamydia sequanensis]|uniref:Alpha-1,4-glucan:maltose-1-phosphate maltosyltransferase n=1 Tax=Candidatus Criblamydia sequanensis CRIB-18 TaxID=1437425 RepID=A0A090CY48_9BACT|nr:alpha-1,4-glucan--maltose-1-phosphate maltosyltransferase [Criblamydia sequanensis]CDR33277.1 Glycosyl hydrolase [Criblamydia sequanensis CRIB-18]